MPNTQCPALRSSGLLLRLLPFVTALLLNSSSTLMAQTVSEVAVLLHANLIDGFSETVRSDATLVLANGKIQAVSTGTSGIPKNARVIDLKGKYVVPGLIDAHVHTRTLADAKRALLSGVTTMRCMGLPHFVDIGMRELGKRGAVDIPEVLAAGYHVRPEPDEGFFLDIPEMADLMQAGVRGEAALRRMGKALTDRGVDWIKTNATARAGLPETDPREPFYTESEMRALVEAGAEKKVPVAAHAHGDEGGLAAVMGGVRSIEHGTYLSEATLKLMVLKGTYLVPTIAVVTDMTRPGGEYDNPVLEIRGRHMLTRVRQMAAMARQLGVQIAAGTDGSYDANSTLRMAQELEELVGIGMTPMEALQSATITAAELLGISGRTGRIAPGLDADLLVIDKNPLENIGYLYDPLMVMNNGKVVLNRLEWKVK